MGAAASGQIHLVQTANWGGLIYQGVVCIGTAYLAWAYAMDAGDTATGIDAIVPDSFCVPDFYLRIPGGKSDGVFSRRGLYLS